jgi:hypothetical protein
VAEFVLRLVECQGEVAGEGGRVSIVVLDEGDGYFAGARDGAFGEVGDLLEDVVEAGVRGSAVRPSREGPGPAPLFDAGSVGIEGCRPQAVKSTLRCLTNV